MTKIFISYSRRNRKYTERLASYLEKSFDVWYDKEIHLGTDWWNKIVKEIEKCDHFIFLISESSVISEYCLKEVELAYELNKHIVPIQIQKTVPLPANLKWLAKLQIELMPNRVTVAGLNKVYAVCLTSLPPKSSEYTEIHRERDLKLLDTIWNFIGSTNVEQLCIQVQIGRIDGTLFVVELLGNYLPLRNRVENKFFHPKIEEKCSIFDRLLDNLHLKLYPYTSLESSIDKEGSIVSFTRIKDSDQFSKLADLAIPLLKAHRELVETSKAILPEYEFPQVPYLGKYTFG